MTKKILTIIISLTLAMFFGVSSVFAWSISIEPVSPPAVTTPDDPFMVYVYFNPDPGGNLFDTYNFDIGYDGGELAWDSTDAGSQSTPPSPLFSLFCDPYEDSYDGYPRIRNFNGAAFGWGPFLTEKTQLAAIVFHPDPGVSDGIDVWMTTPGTSGFTVGPEGDTDPADLQSFTLGVNWPDGTNLLVQGPDVAAVPIPSTMLLFLSGLVGTGISLRRKVV